MTYKELLEDFLEENSKWYPYKEGYNLSFSKSKIPHGDKFMFKYQVSVSINEEDIIISSGFSEEEAYKSVLFTLLNTGLNLFVKTYGNKDTSPIA